MKDMKPCPHCGRLMHVLALTCGSYCRWDELVRPHPDLRIVPTMSGSSDDS
jgi:hypothetical protein